MQSEKYKYLDTKKLGLFPIKSTEPGLTVLMPYEEGNFVSDAIEIIKESGGLQDEEKQSALHKVRD